VAYETGSLQYNWLAADLKAVNRAQTPWIIVNVHTPLYNTNLNKHTSDPTNTVNAPWSKVPVEQQEYGMLAAFETVFFKQVRPFHEPVNGTFSSPYVTLHSPTR
jgi:hypothetical protein